MKPLDITVTISKKKIHQFSGNLNETEKKTENDCKSVEAISPEFHGISETMRLLFVLFSKCELRFEKKTKTIWMRKENNNALEQEIRILFFRFTFSHLFKGKSIRCMQIEYKLSSN